MQWVATSEPTIERQRDQWVVRVRGYDPASGNRRVRQLGTFGTKREAVALQKSLSRRQTGGESETVADFLTGVWLPSKEGRVQPSSMSQYQWAVDRHIIPLMGAVRLRDLTPEVIDRWLRDLVMPDADGAARLGSTSVRLNRKILSMALEEAVQRGRLVRNPVPLTQPPRASRTNRKLSWTLDEAQQFLAAIEEHRLYAAFRLTLVTGLRRGELLGLAWSSVDLEAQQLVVVQQLAIEVGRPVLKQLKTEASERIVTFGASTAEVLRAHQDRQRIEEAAAGNLWTASGLVFTTDLGGWIDPNNFGRTMDGLVDSAGVARITPKGLRHTAQSVGRVVVGDDKVMQERLGHSDIGITLNTYTHTVTEQHRRAGQTLDDVFKRAR